MEANHDRIFVFVKKIIEHSDKIYNGGLNSTIPQLMQNLEKK